jgi:hypothetical protein
MPWSAAVLYHLFYSDSSVLASIEAVNSKNIEIQVNGPCPTMTLDNVNGCQIYLSEENQNVQIFTSKCRRVYFHLPILSRCCAGFTSFDSAVNVVLPQGDQDPKEEAIPEQCVHFLRLSDLTVGTALNHILGT